MIVRHLGHATICCERCDHRGATYRDDNLLALLEWAIGHGWRLVDPNGHARCHCPPCVRATTNV